MNNDADRYHDGVYLIDSEDGSLTRVTKRPHFRVLAEFDFWNNLPQLRYVGGSKPYAENELYVHDEEG